MSAIPRFPVSNSPIGPTNIKQVPGIMKGQKYYMETSLRRIDPVPYLIGIIVALLIITYFAYTTPEINSSYTLMFVVAIGLTVVTVVELKDRNSIPAQQQQILKPNNAGQIPGDPDWAKLAKRQTDALAALSPKQQANLSKSLSLIHASPTTANSASGRGSFFVIGKDGKSMRAVDGTISQMPGLVMRTMRQ